MVGYGSARGLLGGNTSSTSAGFVSPLFHGRQARVGAADDHQSDGRAD